jgi:t-SNARE complex subunit (syntaxin)
MNLEKDLKELRRQKQLKESAIAQLRKRSKDSIARPRAVEKEVKTLLQDLEQKKICYQLIQRCKKSNEKKRKPY